MKKRRFFLIILTALLAAALTACGPSDEKLMEAETAKGLLLEAKESAENTYLDISDTSQRAALDELALKVSEIEALDFSKMNDKKIDEVLPAISEITAGYQDIQGGLSDTLKAETQIRQEAEKHAEIEVYFVNKTGMNISGIVLHDIAKDITSDSFLGDGVILGNGYTLMGAVFDIYKDSSSWELIVTDDAGTEYSFACDDLKGKELKGAAVVLTYDKETGTGSAEISAQSGQ